MKKHFKLIMLFILVVLTAQNVEAAGIGISPSTIDIDQALKGVNYEKRLVVFNMAPESTRYALSSSGDIQDWISFYDMENDSRIDFIDIGAEDQGAVKAVFHIPPDAANGDYSGKIDVLTVPKAKGPTDTSVSYMKVGASIKVNIAVTGEQIVDAEVTAILVEDTEPGMPLKAKALVRNDGNVVIEPKVNVTVLYDDTTIHRFGKKDVPIKPQEIGTITAEWQTTAANLPADYTARVNVSLGDRLLRSEDRDFKILPVGTLSRNGTFSDLIIEGEPKVDTVLKVRAYFKNTGSVDTTAKFKGEVYKDGDLIDTIESDEALVEKNREAVLISYLKPDASGDYTIEGKVTYSGKETPVKEVSTKIGSNLAPGFESTVGISVLLVIYFLMRRKM